MGIKKRRSQVVQTPDEIAASYRQMPTGQIMDLLVLLAPHADRSAGTREFFDLLGAIVRERAAGVVPEAGA